MVCISHAPTFPYAAKIKDTTTGHLVTLLLPLAKFTGGIIASGETKRDRLSIGETALSSTCIECFEIVKKMFRTIISEYSLVIGGFQWKHSHSTASSGIPLISTDDNESFTAESSIPVKNTPTVPERTSLFDLIVGMDESRLILAH